MSGFRSYPTSDASKRPETNEVVLSLTTVHKMLPLVQKITGDIVMSHQAIAHLQPEEERLDRQRRSLDWPGRKRRYDVKEELVNASMKLEHALGEVRELGLTVLNEREGWIGFPTMVNNRRAYFSWHVEENQVGHWLFADEDTERPIPASWLKELSVSGSA